MCQTACKSLIIKELLVPRRGLEPPRISPLVPETSASTSSATWASARIVRSNVISVNTYEAQTMPQLMQPITNTHWNLPLEFIAEEAALLQLTATDKPETIINDLQQETLPSLLVVVIDRQVIKAGGYDVVLSMLRDQTQSRLHVFVAEGSALVNPSLSERTALMALGLVGKKDEQQDIWWCEFDIADYKTTPDWFGPKNWANPELWDQYRW